MTPSVDSHQGSWAAKFRCAGRGMAWGVRSQRSFSVHLAVAAGVVALAAALRASQGEWCLLILCIATVLTAEMFNTAIEHLARAITPDRHDELRDALDTSSGAVLLASLGAATVGTGFCRSDSSDILNQ